ncbi:unnamed protein product [Staurois parvus]|uniref:Uncharacterized protein n=1 Tax=Staurois parvus TaxID=386267 RepID=A0ABN9CZB7_9NEOB|nr:unnamed protein product [Staurois parvus]
MFATLRGPDYKSPDFWGGPPERREGSGRLAHRRAALTSLASRGLPTTELRQPYCLSPGGQCAPEPQQR